MRQLLLLVCLIPFTVLAQNYRISGVVSDGETNQPMEFATVSLLNPRDSGFVSGAVTGPDGRFAISAKQGNYVVRIQFVTYEKRELSEVSVGPNNPALNLGNITLTPSQTELEEVVVQGERTQMQLSLDKKVYNVGKDLSSLGGTASDLLDNLPSVTVDVDGNVQLRGSSNVRILIDGKPSGLVGLSSTDALRQLQGNLIESVEIITNPSARYDAEGQAGIINIILKKERSQGVNGSFQASTGYPHNHGASINMNFRKKWINLFVNYGVDYRQSPGRGSAFQWYSEDTIYTSLMAKTTELSRNHLRSGIGNNVRFGSDFYLNDKTTFTTSFLYRYSDEVNDTDLIYRDFNSNEDLIGYTRREDEETEGDQNLEYALNFTRTFGTKDHKLTADFQYQNNNEIEKSDIVQYEGSTEATSVPELFQQVRNDEGEERFMLQSDYIQPVFSKGKIEAGFRSTLRNVRNIYTVDSKDDPDADFERLEQFSTDFSYNENVHAVYGMVSNEIDRISWQLGLRTETTDINTEREGAGNQNWNYTNYFPSVFGTYKLKDEHQLQLSYSRRINRPRFRELNPFSSFTDNRNFRVGNPDLQPEFTDSYELGFLQNMKASSIYYGIYFRHTDQLITRVTLAPNEDNERYTTPYNIGVNDALGIEVNASQELTDWYRVSGNFNFYRSETTGSVGDSINLAATAITFSTRLSNNLKLGNDFTGQLNVNYRAPRNEPQGRQLAVTVVDLGVSKDIWKKKGTLSLSVRDLFNSRKWRGITELPTFYEESSWQWRRGPSFVLTLNYRLNQKKTRTREGQQEGEFDDEGGF